MLTARRISRLSASRPSSTTARLMALPGHLASVGILRRLLIVSIVAAMALAMLVLVGFAGVPATASGATAPAAAQCDPPAFPTGAGFQVTCTISVANSVTAAGATASTLTTTACLAAAGVVPPLGCTTVVTTSNQLVTSVNQCNGIINGGGSNLTCIISVVNTVPTGAQTTGVTVNQCIGSGAGGGTQPTLVCAPVASTTNATVTQCNGSGNGGGGSTRVQCTVTGAATGEPVTVNQCNGSSNGGGSTVTCAATFTNDFVAAAPAPTPTPTPTPAPTVPGATGATPPGSGATGTTGAAPGAGGSTGTPGGTSTVIPGGAPETGLGGASHSRDNDLLLLGVVALFGAAAAMTMAIRRRRLHSFEGANGSS